MEPVKPFISPHLTGKRFDDHTIPLELLEDFAAFEELLIEVAKWIYLKENNDRKRVPRGFTNGISLKLASIEGGSSIPNIIMAAAMGLFPTETNSYFEKAKETIIQTISAAENNERVTDHIPENLLGYFNRIGKHLKDDEAIDFSPDTNQRAILTKSTRKKLVLASSEILEVTNSTNIKATISEVDKSRRTFTIFINPLHKITAQIQPQHSETIMEAFNNFEQNTKVFISGLGRFNKNDRLESFESIEHISILDPLDISERLDELLLLSDGWLNGEGIALEKSKVDWFANIFNETYDTSLQLPYLYPTIEGGIQAEWTKDIFEITLKINLKDKLGYYHSLNNQTEDVEEESIDLNNKEGWNFLNVELIKKLKD